MHRPEPFTTHKPWNQELHDAYRDQPLRGRYHFQLDEGCSPAEIAAWRDWCKRWPKTLWPNHILAYIARQAATGGSRG